MKKIAMYVAMAAIIVSVNGSKVFAADETTLKAEAGITPDSILYPVDKALDSLNVAFSFSDEAKVEALAEVAEERLGESETMTEAGKTDLASEAMEDYNDKMQEASETLQVVLETKGDSTDESTIQKVEELEKTIQDKQAKSLEVLKNLESKVGDSAKDVISKVIQMQSAKKEAVKAMVEGRHTLNESRKVMNEAKVALEEAKKSGDETAISAAQVALDESQKSYETEKVTMKKLFEEKKAIVKGGIKEIKEANEKAKEQVKQDLESGTITEDQAKDKIEVLNKFEKKSDKKIKESVGKAKDTNEKKEDKKEGKDVITTPENKQTNISNEEKKQDKPNNYGQEKKEEHKPVAPQPQVKTEEVKPAQPSTSQSNGHEKKEKKDKDNNKDNNKEQYNDSKGNNNQ